jgi:hypothetical protein
MMYGASVCQNLFDGLFWLSYKSALISADQNDFLEGHRLGGASAWVSFGFFALPHVTIQPLLSKPQPFPQRPPPRIFSAPRIYRWPFAPRRERGIVFNTNFPAAIRFAKLGGRRRGFRHGFSSEPSGYVSVHRRAAIFVKTRFSKTTWRPAPPCLPRNMR